MDEKWFDEVCKRYPLDEKQKQYKRQIDNDKLSGVQTPFVIIDGRTYYYDNNYELRKAYEKAEDLKYAYWGKQGISRKIREFFKEEKRCTKTFQEKKSYSELFGRFKNEADMTL